jgi:dethiobiotin synthetase
MVSAPVLMIQGTASGVGKSVVVAGLCRLLRRRGLRVAPFKAQNMSNNAAVTADGGEIGRSPALQAAAAGTEPTVEMNPILLKPEADATSQLVVLGVAHGSRNARDYLARTDELWPAVAGSLAALRTRFDVVVAEGAGSPAELNLRARDIVNMRVAREADAAVLLVGDIDRGGVFAQLLGTLDLLEPPERARVKGLIVNRFRGDPSLFADGVRILEERSGLPLLGVVPMVPNLDLPEEDGAALERRPEEMGTPGQLRVVVVRLPRIANFDEFAPVGPRAGVASGVRRPAGADRGSRSGRAARNQGHRHRPRVRPEAGDRGRPRCRALPRDADPRGVRRVPDARPLHPRPARHRDHPRLRPRARPAPARDGLSFGEARCPGPRNGCGAARNLRVRPRSNRRRLRDPRRVANAPG